MITQATIDAYTFSEQAVGFLTLLEEHLVCPFRTTLLGRPATVLGIDIDPDDQIFALCASGRYRQRVPILDLPLPHPRPNGAEWIEAYRHWLNPTR